MEDLEKIENSLIRLQKELNAQLSVVSTDSKEFHSSLIELIAKYPNHKDVIQFTVGINDRIETSQSIFSDIIVDAINEMIEVKHEMIRKMIALHKPTKEGFFVRTKNKMTTKDFMTKVFYIVTALAVIALVSGAIFAPESTISVFDSAYGKDDK